MKHLRYGGSTINRTINCPTWRTLADDMPPGKSSDFAREGTLLHNCMEEIIVDQLEQPADLLIDGREFEGVKLTPELVAEKLEPALEAVEAMCGAHKVNPDTLIVEPFVEYRPGLAGGSIDLLGFSKDGKTALIVDYKFGYNSVSAQANPQMMFYALSADSTKKFQPQFDKVETLVLAIIQPNDQGEVADVYECPITDLDAFEDLVAAKIEKAESDDPGEPCPGDWCAYCPAEAICPAKTGQLQLANRLDITQVGDLTQAQGLVKELKAWCKAVEKLVHEQLEQGVEIPGWKLVNKRATRVWNDSEAVEDKIRRMRNIKIDDARDYTLKSPAQMEKLFKQNKVAFKLGDDISAVSSGTTLAPESDKRPAVLPTLALKALADRLN